jgi:hypothetical protein
MIKVSIRVSLKVILWGFQIGINVITGLYRGHFYTCPTLIYTTSMIGLNPSIRYIATTMGGKTNMKWICRSLRRVCLSFANLNLQASQASFSWLYITHWFQTIGVVHVCKLKLPKMVLSFSIVYIQALEIICCIDFHVCNI